MAKEQTDDDISIDFGKITGFFKKKAKGSQIKEDCMPSGHKEPEKEKILQSDMPGQGKGSPADDSNKIGLIVPKPSEPKAEKANPDDDDEIRIDFKNIFRMKGRAEDKPGKEQKKDVKQAEAKDDEDIALDFGKVSGWFKKDKSKAREARADDEDSLDWGRFTDFIVKYKVLFLLLIPLFLAVFISVQPAYLTVTDDWARNAVESSIKSQISSQIDRQNPNMPANYKEIQVQAELDKYLKQNKEQLNSDIKQVSAYFKSQMEDTSGLPYMSSIDPYYWTRFSENIVDHGYPGDEIKNGVQWDNHMIAPVGRAMPSDMFHAYFQAYLFMFLRIFNNSISLIAVAFFVPVVIAALSVIPAFFIGRKLGGGLGGFIAATIVAIHPALLARNIAGAPDTDGYVLLFPLLIAWLYMESVDSKSMLKTIILGAISGLLVGVFSFAWAGGWWFIFDLIIASFIIYIIYFLASARNGIKSRLGEIKSAIVGFLAFLSFSSLSIFLIRGVTSLIYEPFNSPLGFTRFKEVGITTIWPNVFTTVAEQNPSSVSEVIKDIGFNSWIYLLLALVGLLLCISKSKEKRPWLLISSVAWYCVVFLMQPQDLYLFIALISLPIVVRLAIAIIDSETGTHIKISLLLIIWAFATIYASVKGVRYMILLVPAFGIGLGIALSRIHQEWHKWLSSSLNINRTLSKALILSVIVVFFFILPIFTSGGSWHVAKSQIPMMNDAWYGSLEKIKTDSAPDAIINSWWDYGHWFKAIADRRVTFDGTSQSGPQAHWIGNALLTPDEDTSIGILRMLDCSASQAYNNVYPHFNDEAKTIDFLYRVIRKDRKDALETYAGWGFKANETKNLIEMTHCYPPEDYFITSDDMVQKAGVWAHFGAWDFNKALIYKTLKSKGYKDNLDTSVAYLTGRFNYSNDSAESIYFQVQDLKDSAAANDWISPWPGYLENTMHDCSPMKDNKTIQCNYFKAISSTGNNQVVLESSYFSLDNLSNISVKLGVYDQRSGQKVGERYARPDSVGILDEMSGFSLIKIPDGSLGLDIAIDLSSGAARSMVTVPKITGSMFNRLYFMDGLGLKHFKKISDEKSFSGNRIVIWKIDWEGNDTNVYMPAADVFNISQVAAAGEGQSKEINTANAS